MKPSTSCFHVRTDLQMSNFPVHIKALHTWPFTKRVYITLTQYTSTASIQYEFWPMREPDLTQPQQSQSCLNNPAQQREHDGDNGVSADIWRTQQRHDGRGTQRDVFGCAEHAIDEAAHERRIQTVLQNKTRSIWRFINVRHNTFLPAQVNRPPLRTPGLEEPR